MPSYDTNRGAKAARVTRERFGLAPDAPIDCLHFAEREVGVPVVVMALPEGFAGAYLERAGRPVIFVSADGALVRRRFSLAHELGHHCLRHPRHVDTWEGMTIGQRHPQEVQANAFAAELLAPKLGVVGWLRDAGRPAIGLDVVVRLAARFGMSCAAMRYRLATCDALPDRRLGERLDAEIAADEHLALIKKLDVDWPDDELARADGDALRLPDGFEHARASVVARLAR